MWGWLSHKIQPFLPSPQGHSFFIGASGQLSSPPLQYTKPNSKFQIRFSTLYCCHGNKLLLIIQSKFPKHGLFQTMSLRISLTYFLLSLCSHQLKYQLISWLFFFSSLDHLTYILLFKNNFFFDQIISNKFSKYACLDICGVCPSIYLYKITLKFR